MVHGHGDFDRSGGVGDPSERHFKLAWRDVMDVVPREVGPERAPPVRELAHVGGGTSAT